MSLISPAKSNAPSRDECEPRRPRTDDAEEISTNFMTSLKSVLIYGLATLVFLEDFNCAFSTSPRYTAISDSDEARASLADRSLRDSRSRNK